jgi:hypothetical protein
LRLKAGEGNGMDFKESSADSCGRWQKQVEMDVEEIGQKVLDMPTIQDRPHQVGKIARPSCVTDVYRVADGQFSIPP